MKTLALLTLGLQAVSAKVSYDGYKVYHIDTADYDGTRSALSGLDYVSLDCEDDHKSFDVAVAPASLEAFEALGLDVELTIEDLGVELATEGELTPYKCEISPP
jgi:hypothetical protein